MSSPILFLHGAGTSDKNRTKYLQDIFKENNVKTYSFNFTGHGGIERELAKSSLKNRLKEALDSVEKFNLKEPLNICGSSMGGYIGIKLLEHYNVRNLILFSPAVYDIKAFNTLFGREFTNIIRAENSWKNSDAFNILNKFKGNVLIFVGEEDKVIPRELIQLIEESLINIKYMKIVFIPDCPHAIHRWLSQNNDWTQKISKEIMEFIEK